MSKTQALSYLHKDGHFRFHYPRPPSPLTIIAEEFYLGMCSSNQADEAFCNLVQHMPKMYKAFL